MKLLLHYLSPYKALIALTLLLAAINQYFSLLDPYILGHYLIDPLAKQASVYAEQGLSDGYLKEY